eukprot:4993571-Prymnesium_polylepis.1
MATAAPAARRIDAHRRSRTRKRTASAAMRVGVAVTLDRSLLRSFWKPNVNMGTVTLLSCGSMKA